MQILTSFIVNSRVEGKRLGIGSAFVVNTCQCSMVVMKQNWTIKWSLNSVAVTLLQLGHACL